MRVVGIYHHIPSRKYQSRREPYQTVHDLPDIGLRVINYFGHYEREPIPVAWCSETGEVLDDVPF